MFSVARASNPRTVPDRYQDLASALVALNVFDAFNEYLVEVLLLANKRVKCLIGATRLVNLICDLIALDRRECYYPERLRRGLGCVCDKGVDDRLRLDRVGSLASSIVGTLDAPKYENHPLRVETLVMAAKLGRGKTLRLRSRSENDVLIDSANAASFEETPRASAKRQNALHRRHTGSAL